MGLANVRSEIKNLLESVPGIGKVHDYQRWTDDWESLLELFKDSSNKINGWTISFPRSTERKDTPGINIGTHDAEIIGYYGLEEDGESEKVFQGLIEEVCSVLRNNNSLKGSCWRCEPPQVVKVYKRSFGGVLAYACMILLQAKERIEYA